jgi:AraC family transcriptional regulator
MGCFLAAIDNPAAVSPLMMSHVGQAIDSHLAHHGGRPDRIARGGGRLAPWQERRAKEILAANLDGKVAIADIAAQCGLSPAYFATAFKASAGKSPTAWLLEQRLQHARTLLQTSRGSLQEIALACGFSDQPHFTRQFSKMVGISPGQWRITHLAAA